MAERHAPGDAVAGHAPWVPGPAAPWTPSRRFDRWLQQPGTARLVLLAALLATALAWYAARHHAKDEARQRFERRTDDLQGRIDRRMASYEAMLRGGVALLAAQPGLTRAQWHEYVATVRPELHYPGIQGFGVARLIAPGDLAAHEQAVRAEGFPDYRVRPGGPRDVYTSIVFLEPFVARNLRAFGFDMMSEATRRAAMERARDRGEPAASGIVTLVQEDGRDVQKGFLLYLPVYTGGQPRADQLWGWVYAPFRVGDLMAGILGRDVGQIDFRVHDGEAGPADTAFYRSDAAAATGAIEFTQQRTLKVAGREWTVVYDGRGFASAAGTWWVHLVGIAGLAIDLILFASIAALSRRKRQVEHEVQLRSAEVRARNAWLDAVAGLSPDGTLVFERGDDGEHRLVFANPAFGQWFGLKPGALLGLTETQADDALRSLAQDGVAMPALCGDDALIELAGAPRRVLRRGVCEGERHRVYYFRDVTHETEVDSLKNEFLATAAHELRTPLAGIYGFAELLLNEDVPTAQRRRANVIVHRQAGVLKRLVEELLDLSRIDSRGGRDFHVVRFDLGRIAELAAESTFLPGVPSRVRVSLGEATLWVDADPLKLQQAITNVLSNALKYSPPDSTVSLDLLTREHDGRRYACVRIVDAGIGMTPAQSARAFDRFYRADPSGQTLGAGLGLAIVKEIVGLHGGAVMLHSTPGAGTQVTLSLPLRAAPAAVARAGLAQADPALAEP